MKGNILDLKVAITELSDCVKLYNDILSRKIITESEELIVKRVSVKVQKAANYIGRFNGDSKLEIVN